MSSLQQQLGKQAGINLTLLKQMLSDDKKLPKQWISNLVQSFTYHAKNQPNVLFIQEPVIVIGDLHGQFFDFLKIFSLFPSLQTEPKQYLLFLGDYVDRGPMGLEVTLLLMAMKIKFPRKVVMLRGNHETRQMTQLMNFYGQVCGKYDQNLYFKLMDAFDSLPLVCIVNNSYFCVHGGITADGESIEQLNQMNRFVQVPLKGSLCDLVWADPVQEEDGSIYNDENFIDNYQRNCSIFFGSKHTRNFLKKTKLITVIRAHEVQLEGYKQHMWPKWKDSPMVYTLFSAPNYCGSYGNLGAILTINNSEFSIRQFKETDPKYYLPPRFNAFNISLPSIFTFLDQMMRRMARRWVALKMPQLKDADSQVVLALYLKSDHCAKLKRMDIKSVSVMSKGKQLTGEECFRKSIGYFSQSERRPASLIYTSK